MRTGIYLLQEVGRELPVTSEVVYCEQKMKIFDSLLKPGFWAQARHLAKTTTPE